MLLKTHTQITKALCFSIVFKSQVITGLKYYPTLLADKGSEHSMIKTTYKIHIESQTNCMYITTQNHFQDPNYTNS